MTDKLPSDERVERLAREVKRPYPRTAPVAIECRTDGIQVYALIGEDYMTGCVGFGDDLPSALRALAVSLEREVGQEPAESSAVALAVASAYWIAAQAIATTPFRCHAEEDRDFHSGCVQTKDAILDAVRALTPADAQAALARFKADAVREARLDEQAEHGTCSFFINGVAVKHDPNCKRHQRLAALQPPSGEKS